jgi:VWFA-related protein
VLRVAAIVFVLAGLLLAPLLLGQSGQVISDDEIRWGSRPYAPDPPRAIHVQSTLVQVPVLVTDSRGKPVAGLNQSDFHVFDKGKEQVISLFSVERAPTGQPETVTLSGPVNAATPPPAPPKPPKPRYVAFFFDDDNLPMSDMVFARQAATKCVSEGLNPGDKIGIFTSSTTVSLNFTTNKEKLLETISQLRTHAKASLSSFCPKMDAYSAYLIFNHLDQDAHDLGLAQTVQCAKVPRAEAENLLQVQAAYIMSLAEDFSRQTTGVLTDVINYLGTADGSRMLIMASSGFFASSTTMQREQDRVVDAAIRNGIVINALDAKGLVASWVGGDPAEDPENRVDSPRLQMVADILADQTRDAFNDPLAAIAYGTGGKFFHNNNDLGRGLRDLTAVPEVSYVVGFAPAKVVRDGTYHNLKIKLTTPSGLKVSARPGYFAPTRALSPPKARRKKLTEEVLASNDHTDFPVDVTADLNSRQLGTPAVKVSFHVDAQKLPFQKLGDRKVERLVFVTAVFDSQNHFITGIEGVMDLSLKDSSYAMISGHGLDARLSLDAPPGSYRLRQVVQEEASGHITAISRNIRIQ